MTKHITQQTGIWGVLSKFWGWKLWFQSTIPTWVTSQENTGLPTLSMHMLCVQLQQKWNNLLNKFISEFFKVIGKVIHHKRGKIHQNNKFINQILFLKVHMQYVLNVLWQNYRTVQGSSETFYTVVIQLSEVPPTSKI